MQTTPPVIPTPEQVCVAPPTSHSAAVRVPATCMEGRHSRCEVRSRLPPSGPDGRQDPGPRGRAGPHGPARVCYGLWLGCLSQLCLPAGQGRGRGLEWPDSPRLLLRQGCQVPQTEVRGRCHSDRGLPLWQESGRGGLSGEGPVWPSLS